MLLLLALPAAADPWFDAEGTARATCVRSTGADQLLGAGEWRPPARVDADCVSDPGPGLLPNREENTWSPHLTVRPALTLIGGDATPDNARGDAEAGLFGARLAARAVLAAGPLALDVEPEVGLDVVPGAVFTPTLRTLWLDARWRSLSAGFGQRDRWIGPARHGALALSDNARPAWMGSLAVDGRLPGWLDRIGRFRVDLGAGWLAEPRPDVANPALLLWDLRWAPIPLLELGATRLSIFGGEGRPAVDVGQLLLPTEPHIYEDPDQLLPDQDELAVLDARLTLPIERWTGAPIPYVEAWIQYGGEDLVMAQEPFPYPSLAGVGNLYGGEVRVADIVVTAEYSRLMDDYFRWYVGHRVYHDGFTQNGRVMGQLGGPDSEVMYGAVAWEGAGPRVRLWVDHTRRVGVIEAQNDRLFTFMEEERGLRVGADAQVFVDLWTITGSYSFEHTTGDDFVPGTTADRHRVSIGLAIRIPDWPR